MLEAIVVLLVIVLGLAVGILRIARRILENLEYQIEEDEEDVN
jgi:hypothetical protein